MNAESACYDIRENKRQEDFTMNTSKKFATMIHTPARALLLLIIAVLLTVSGAAADGSSGLTRGISYGELTGKQADHVLTHKEDGVTEYVYERVTPYQVEIYCACLYNQGFRPTEVKTDLPGVFVYRFADKAQFSFLMAYDRDQELLSLIFSGIDAAGVNPAGAKDTADPAAVNPSGIVPQITTPTPDPHTGHDDGKCSICHGKGYEKCELCGGTGICGVCGGLGDFYGTGYGVGSGSYVECAGCHGSRQCEYCSGTGKQECMFCNGGF